MAKNLRKFMNSRFVKTIDLEMLRRLFERQPSHDAGQFIGTPDVVRGRLADLFTGPESQLSEGLVIDLHRISELGSERGMTLLQARADYQGIRIVPNDQDYTSIIDPKHFAMLAFLDYPTVFDSASDLLVLEARSSVTEYVGEEEGIDATLNDGTRKVFEASAGALFSRDERSSYCKLKWYDDGGDINIVAIHGAPSTLQSVIDGQAENVITYRAAEQSVVSYHPPTGRLKVSGVSPARRAALANMFAETMLGRRGFFAGPNGQRLYTLSPVEEQGYLFRIDHAFDHGLLKGEIFGGRLRRRAQARTQSGHSRAIFHKGSRRGQSFRLGFRFGGNFFFCLHPREWWVAHFRERLRRLETGNVRAELRNLGSIGHLGHGRVGSPCGEDHSPRELRESTPTEEESKACRGRRAVAKLKHESPHFACQRTTDRLCAGWLNQFGLGRLARCTFNDQALLSLSSAQTLRSFSFDGTEH